MLNFGTYKSLAFGVSFCLDRTTLPSSLRLTDSAVTVISPTGCPRKLVTETSTDGFCAFTDDGLTRETTTGTEF